jgi:hypothetical protein
VAGILPRCTGEVSRDPAKYLPAVRTSMQRSSRARRLAVTGSLGMVLQGWTCRSTTLIQTTRTVPTRSSAALRNTWWCLCFTLSACARFGKLNVEGIQVEIIGGIQKRSQDGEWDQPVQVAPHRLWVEVDGLSVPVLSLEYEYEAYKIMGRDEKAAKIRQWLDRQSSG